MSTARQHDQQITRTEVRRPAHDERLPRAGVPAATLAAASLSSVVSAIVVSHIWGPGTLYGAAATPVIVALVSEAVQRPKRVIASARQSRATRSFDPVEEGRRGLREGDVATPDRGGGAGRTVHRAPTGLRIPRQRRIRLALATGLLAFALAAFALTGGELVFGSSAVGGVSSRTTLFGGTSSSAADSKSQSKSGATSQSKSSAKTQTTTQPSSGAKTQTTTQPTAPTPTATTPTPTTPSPTTGPTPTAPGGSVAPPATSGPSATPPPTNSPSPSTNQPPSKTTPAPSVTP